jgi:hypothetical protein
LLSGAGGSVPYQNVTAPQNWFFVPLTLVVCCQVLVEGLPDWRMPAYYFRRMRKIGLAEGLAYLLGEIFPYFLRLSLFFKFVFQYVLLYYYLVFCLIVSNAWPK